MAPPIVNCDRTAAPLPLPKVPALASAADLPLNDDYLAEVIGMYQVEVTIRLGEHACMDKLRQGGVIQ